MKTSHIYPGASTLSAYITVKGASDAIEFYKEAFGAIEKGRLMNPDGKIGHAEVEIEGSLLMLADENIDWGNKGPHSIGGNPMTFVLYVEDADQVFKKAVDAGASVVMPVEDMFYGERSGRVLDPFGYRWMITTHQEDMSFDEMQKRSNELFSKKEMQGA